MAISYLTSAFTEGFTEAFITALKQEKRQQGAFVFVTSDFWGYEKNDRYAVYFKGLIEAIGYDFDQMYVIDHRLEKETMLKAIQEAAMIFISGGDTLKQIAHIKEHDLLLPLRNYEGITIGMSAGAINMAKRVVLAKDEEDNIPELSIYEGIGLVELNIEPHINAMRQEHMADIEAAKKHGQIIGLPDNAFIRVEGDQVTYYGDYCLF